MYWRAETDEVRTDAPAQPAACNARIDQAIALWATNIPQHWAYLEAGFLLDVAKGAGLAPHRHASLASSTWLIHCLSIAQVAVGLATGMLALPCWARPPIPVPQGGTYIC